jgi:hypothetical protein
MFGIWEDAVSLRIDVFRARDWLTKWRLLEAKVRRLWQ